MKKISFLLFTMLAFGLTGWGQIISQYVETSSGISPKGIEIWNNTASELDFSTNSLEIKKGTNGGAPATDYTLSTGTLAAGAIIVIGTSDMQTETESNGATFYVKAFTFNGDDALEVWYGATKTDVFGEPGNDPGSAWEGSGVSTANQNIQLLSGITTGDTDGWTDPSTRFETVCTNNCLTGFGIAPTGGGNPGPVITNIMHNPDAPQSTETVGVQADVTDDNSVQNVNCLWSTTDGGPYTTIAMSFDAGTTYITDSDILAQSVGTTVYYKIEATDDESETTTSAQQSYTVTDPATTTLPYFEPFNSDLGDCYTYSVTGDSKEWWWQSQYGNGFASVNGYNSGVVEEDWLILPGVNLDDYDGARMLFEARYEYGYDNYENDLLLMYSTDYPGIGDPSGFTWQELNYYKPGVSDSWEPCGDIDLSFISGEMVYIAFKYKYGPGYYRYWSIDNISIVPSCQSGMTVYLKNSQGGLLSGGNLQFQDGGWHTATEIYDGIFCVETNKPEINLKMTYAEADLLVTVPTNYHYTFQTVKVTFELRKRTGDLGYNHGQIFYQGYGGLLATTGDAGLGLAELELLPREYTFRMKFRGGRGDITQDVNYNSVVTWQMARMLVQINKSDGTRGLNGADIKYKGSSLEHFGVTGTSENGRARRDLLPGFYKFTIKYKGAKQVVEDFEVVLGDNELIIDGVATTVELLESGTDLPVDGARVRNIGVSSNEMGYTGDNGPGIVTVDLLPVIYSFEVTLDGDQETFDGIDITTTPWVTFYTDDLKSSELNQMEGVTVSVFPNPFVSNTTFGVSLEEDQYVNISIYDITGKLVANLYDGQMQQGNHKVIWVGENAQNGMYICRMTTENNTYSKILLKN